MGHLDQEALKRLAAKYICWKTPDEAKAMPQRVAARVMNIGDYEEVQVLARVLGDESEWRQTYGEAAVHAAMAASRWQGHDA